MIVDRIIRTRLDLNKIHEIFPQNYNDMLLNKLKENFTNICYKSCYILNINDIIARGNPICKNKKIDGSMYIDIVFSAKVLIYEKYEIIHNCEIIHIDDSMGDSMNNRSAELSNNSIIHAKAKYTSLFIKNNKNIDIFKIGQKIPVIVIDQGYNPFLNEISISAIPFQPIEKDLIFYHIDDSKSNIKQDTIIKLIDHLTEIENSITTKKKENKKSFEFLRNTIYPFEKEQKYNKNINKLDITKNIKQQILELKNFKNLVLFRPTSYLDDNKIYYFSRKNNVDLYPDVELELSIDEILIKLINDYRKSLYVFQGFLEQYDTLDKIKEDKIIWQMYKFLKI